MKEKVSEIYISIQKYSGGYVIGTPSGPLVEVSLTKALAVAKFWLKKEVSIRDDVGQFSNENLPTITPQ